MTALRIGGKAEPGREVAWEIQVTWKAGPG